MSPYGSEPAYDNPNTAVPTPTDMDEEWSRKDVERQSHSRPQSESGDPESTTHQDKTEDTDMSRDTNISKPKSNVGAEESEGRPPPPPPGAICLAPGCKFVSAAGAPRPPPPPSAGLTGTSGRFYSRLMKWSTEAVKAWQEAETDEDRENWYTKHGPTYTFENETTLNPNSENTSGDPQSHPIQSWLDKQSQSHDAAASKEDE